MRSITKFQNIFLGIILCGHSLLLHAQENLQTIDALSKEKAYEEEFAFFEKKIDSLFRIQFFNESISFPNDSVDAYSDKMVAAMQKVKRNDSINVMIFLKLTSIYKFEQKELVFLDSVESIARRMNDNMMLGQVYLSRGIRSSYYRKYNEAIKNHKNALRYYEIEKYGAGMGSSYHFISKMYGALEMDSLRLKMGRYALSIWDTLKNPSPNFRDFAILPLRFELAEQESFQKMEAVAPQLISIYEKNKLEREVVFTYVKFGLGYLREGMYDQAFSAFTKAEKTAVKDTNKMIAYLGFSSYYSALSEFTEEKEYFDTYHILSIEKIRNINQFTNLLGELDLVLKINKKIKKFDLSLNYNSNKWLFMHEGNEIAFSSK